MPSFEEQQASLKSALVAATVLANDLPDPQDIGFHRSMSRSFATDVDSASDQILSLTNKLLDLVRVAQSEKQANGRKRRPTSALASVDDVNDDFDSAVVDVVDFLFETADSCFDEAKGLKKKATATQANGDATATATAPKVPSQASLARGRLPASILNASHLEKPQLLLFAPTDNARDTIWTPTLPSKPNALVPLDLTPVQREDEGLGEIANPYTHELSLILDNLPQDILTTIQDIPAAQAKDSFDTTPFVFVDDLEKYHSMLSDLSTAKAIAVDLEHHDFRTYTGLVCLIQISIEGKDFVIDALAPEVRKELHKLNLTFTDPKIIKVFHGAERDIIWLQRDCGVYVVGLFDTFHASKALGFPSNSLAALLERYCAFEADKRYQMADWRIRPLPDEMLHYARSDTHYLLFVYYTMLAALHALPPNESHTIVQSVFLKSAKTASQSYTPVQYDTQSGSGAVGWRSLIQKWGKGNQYAVPPPPHAYTLPEHKGDLEFHVFRAVHDWRDQVAREEDESPRFVMAHHTLFKLAEKRPGTVAEVMACISPASAIVVRRKGSLAKTISEAVEEWEERPDVVVSKPQDVQMEVDRPMASAPIVPVGLWDEAPSSATATASTMFNGDSSKTSDISHDVQTSKSALFNSTNQAKQALDTRFQDVLKTVHSSLSLALSFAMTSNAPNGASVQTASTEPSADHVFVPTAQRTTNVAPLQASSVQEPPISSTSALPADSSDEEDQPMPAAKQDDNEVVTLAKMSKSDRKKLKRSQSDATAEGESPRKKKKKSKMDKAEKIEPAKLEPYDYSQDVSILDQPAPSAPIVKREKKVKPKKESKPNATPFMRPRDNANTSTGERSMTFLK